MEPYSLSDCGSLDDEELDEELLSATIESFQTGKLTPLLKTELKCRIQQRCFEEGKDLTWDEEPKSEQIQRPLLPFEVERQERRREQNRRAAKKFRLKRRQTSGELNKILIELEEKNRQLKEEIKRLLAEMDMIRAMMSSHMCTTPEVEARPASGSPLHPREFDIH